MTNDDKQNDRQDVALSDARQLAAQCWCDEETKHIEMDITLAEAFARRLDALMETYRMQLAGISTAALGYWKESDSIHPDYDTVALRDVAKLYAKYDALYRASLSQVLRGWNFDRLASGAILISAPSLGHSARVVDVKSRTEGDRLLFVLADALLGTEQPDWIAAAETPNGDQA